MTHPEEFIDSAEVFLLLTPLEHGLSSSSDSFDLSPIISAEIPGGDSRLLLLLLQPSSL